jgi:hypothetical protein
VCFGSVRLLVSSRTRQIFAEKLEKFHKFPSFPRENVTKSIETQQVSIFKALLLIKSKIAPFSPLLK